MGPTPDPKPMAWLGEGDGFKSFTRQKSVADRWGKSIAATPVYGISAAFAKPVPTPDGAVEALRRAKQTLERYHRAGLGDEVFHSDLTDALRVVNAALETPWQKPGRAAQAQEGE